MAQQYKVFVRELNHHAFVVTADSDDQALKIVKSVLEDGAEEPDDMFFLVEGEAEYETTGEVQLYY